MKKEKKVKIETFFVEKIELTSKLIGGQQGDEYEGYTFDTCDCQGDTFTGYGLPHKADISRDGTFVSSC